MNTDITNEMTRMVDGFLAVMDEIKSAIIVSNKKYLCADEIKKLMNIETSTLENWEKDGLPYYRRGDQKGKKLYAQKDIEKFIEKYKRGRH